MHHMLGIAGLLGLVAFAFGERVARFIVQCVLVGGVVGFILLVALDWL